QSNLAALAASKKLAQKPDDPEANLAAGKFALLRGEFEKAFALLAKGSDPVLSSLAKQEISPAPQVAEQMKLAEAWFDRAEKEPSPYFKARMQERAALWYENALPALTGLSKI